MGDWVGEEQSPSHITPPPPLSVALARFSEFLFLFLAVMKALIWNSFLMI